MSAGLILALVPAILLVWYTFVVPPGPLGSRRPVRGDELRSLKPAAGDGAQAAQGVDWPEYIYP
jgi:hypothetical protein